MSTYEIPLTNQAQTLSVSLSGVTYNLLLVFNSTANVWVLDISDINQKPLVRGIPLVANTDLLAPYTDMNFGGTMFAQTDYNLSQPPDYEDLGTTAHLYFVTKP